MAVAIPAGSSVAQEYQPVQIANLQPKEILPIVGQNLILAQNPMNLEWRLNGETLNNYNYKPGDTISGQIIAVDDQWNGLNITKDFSVNIGEASDINTVTAPDASATWYTIDGQRLQTKPTKPGVYIENGQKVTIK